MLRHVFVTLLLPSAQSLPTLCVTLCHVFVTLLLPSAQYLPTLCVTLCHVFVTLLFPNGEYLPTLCVTLCHVFVTLLLGWPVGPKNFISRKSVIVSSSGTYIDRKLKNWPARTVTASKFSNSKTSSSVTSTFFIQRYVLWLLWKDFGTVLFIQDW